MKFKLIIPFLFPLFLSAQNSTFESVFQTLNDKNDNKTQVHHFKLQAKVTKDIIEVTQLLEDKTIQLFVFPVEMETIDNNIYSFTDEKGCTVLFIDKEQKITVINKMMTWVIYGKIPSVVNIKK